MKSLVKRFGGMGLVLLAAGTLFAQPAAPAAPPLLPATEMTIQVTGFKKDVVEAHRLVTTLQLQARKDKDVIRLNCINDKLIQLKALRNVFDDHVNRYESSQNATDQATTFNQAQDNWNKIRSVREQALLCVGETQFLSESKAGWDGPDIPDDPGKDLFPDVPEDPGYASPYN
ncbi:MAG: hypothetical protein H0V17_08450 [Deltaproteobacteria bacterium]|nr:hypothetical protein [Deltaproteobacteria bacterium]